MQNEFLRLQSVLQKTIVFITHDFDEAIRLADRIAIMHDGASCRSARPRSWSCAPADAYVAEFTREAPRAKDPFGTRDRPCQAQRRMRRWAASPADSKVGRVCQGGRGLTDRLRRVRCRRHVVGVVDRAAVMSRVDRPRGGTMTRGGNAGTERAPSMRASPALFVWIGFAALADHLLRRCPTARFQAGCSGDTSAAGAFGLDKAISNFMNWLVDDASFGLFTFREATRTVSAVLKVPLTAATAMFSTGLLRGSGSTAVQLAPPLPWVAVVGVAAALGYRFGGGCVLRSLAARCFFYLAVFGQWASAMTTLASIAIAVPLGVAGRNAVRHRRLPRARLRGGSWSRSSISCRRCRSSPISCRSCSCSASARWRR